MSLNPSYDPQRDNRTFRPNDYQNDEEYMRQVAQPQPGYYANPAVTRQVTTTPVQVNTQATVVPRDRVRWGPIVAGLVSAFATLLILSLLGVAVGLTAATGDPNGGAVAATAKSGNYGMGATIWAIVSALISFFIGGYVAARTAAVRGKGNGWINGALVWALAIPLLLWLATTSASGFLNGIGFNLNSFINNLNGAINNAPSTTSDPATVQSAAETARNGAWGALAALLVGLIASGLGGLLGGRSYDDDFNENDGVAR